MKSERMTTSLLYHRTYEHKSSSKWVVFVHGAGGSSTTWFKQISAFRKNFNVLLIDLRGHGRSNHFSQLKEFINKQYSFKVVSQDILDVLDHLNIKSAHFVGMSLGTIIIRNLAEIAQDRVSSMVLAGAITRFNFRSQFLIKMGDMTKNIMPYMWLYKLFSYVVMPQKSQKESRHIFTREAKKLCQKEFKRWFKLAADVNPLMRYFKDKELAIPTLYVMGANDYLFMKPVEEMVAVHEHSQLLQIPECGHVCNIDKPKEFNKHAIEFIAAQ